MNQDFSGQQANIQKLLSTAEGRKLLTLLSQNGGGTLQQAGNALKQGNTQQAQNLMAPLLEDPEVQRLLRSLEKTLGHG